jgi:uncharacterized protein (DUF952 family)
MACRSLKQGKHDTSCIDAPERNQKQQIRNSVIYHILTSAEWESASRNPFYSPTGFAADGFIHCCHEEQLEYVGKRYFRGQQGLVILCIYTEKVTAPIKNEDSNGEGMLFPHIYGVLNTNAVCKVVPFPSSADGGFVVSHAGVN